MKSFESKIEDAVDNIPCGPVRKSSIKAVLAAVASFSKSELDLTFNDEQTNQHRDLNKEFKVMSDGPLLVLGIN